MENLTMELRRSETSTLIKHQIRSIFSLWQKSIWVEFTGILPPTGIIHLYQLYRHDHHCSSWNGYTSFETDVWKVWGRKKTKTSDYKRDVINKEQLTIKKLQWINVTKAWQINLNRCYNIGKYYTAWNWSFTGVSYLMNPKALSPIG